METETFKELMTRQRTVLAEVVATAAEVKAAIAAADQQDGQDKGEMIANVTLALRAAEDAAMRFGKAVQAASGGVSPLGGPNTPGTAGNPATV